MAAMGRPPKPSEQKRRLGNPGKRALPALASVAPLSAAVEPAPDHLEPDGRELWDRVSRGAVWLAPSDLFALTLLCELADRRARYAALLSEQGPTLTNPSGRVVANPLVAMMSAAERQMVELASLLGLTPADRSRLGVAEVRAGNALEDMLRKRAEREHEPE
ncbi:P27 family predicted phage terminase small subunit [Streptacidiphilus sp. MAP12-33]|uniref:phage terminase small subunit P27 family n=1 Tax=Streptacidiphilus sp. MAP12-33 TaxID=3156266 RepID=UPI0035156D89